MRAMQRASKCLTLTSLVYSYIKTCLLFLGYKVVKRSSPQGPKNLTSLKRSDLKTLIITLKRGELRT